MATMKKRKNSSSGKARKKSRKEAVDKKPSCMFLELPRELRDEIYELLLPVKDYGRDAVILGKENVPAFAQTCTQIRREMLELWLNENDFIIQVTDCDARVVLQWRQFFAAHQSGFPDVIQLDGNISKSRLDQWCKWIHEGKLAPTDFEELTDCVTTSERIVHCANKLAHQFKGKSWEDLRIALDAVYAVAHGFRRADARDPTLHDDVVA